MKFTLCSNWLRERAGLGHLARSGTITFSGKKKEYFFGHIISPSSLIKF